ncbi:MAG TPA: hypothetical protein VGE26_10355 [Sphingobacteriaceae bacterium]
MKKLLTLIALLITVNISYAQRFTFKELQQTLNASLDKTYEEFFLKGFALVDQKSDREEESKVFTFSNRRKTPATAKLITKGEYKKEPLRNFVQYVTYEYSEFRELRQLMTEMNFNRKDDKISENSDFKKDNLEVNFRTDLVKGRRTFIVTLRNTSAPATSSGPLKKLKRLLKTRPQ